MTKLTDTELILLSRAAQREDRAVTFTAEPKGWASKAVPKLIERGLITEITTIPPMPVYRQEDGEKARSLVITDLGLVAIGVSGETVKASVKKPIAKTKSSKGKPPAAGKEKTAKAPSPPLGKTALVIELLQRKQGASLAVLTQATGWLPHSTRAALTGLRKKGYAIERHKAADDTTVYKISKAASVKAA